MQIRPQVLTPHTLSCSYPCLQAQVPYKHIYIKIVPPVTKQLVWHSLVYVSGALSNTDALIGRLYCSHMCYAIQFSSGPLLFFPP